jgi:hypothetical protein
LLSNFSILKFMTVKDLIVGSNYSSFAGLWCLARNLIFINFTHFNGCLNGVACFLRFYPKIIKETSRATF